MKKICIFSLLLFSFFMGEGGIAQVAIGQWRDHLSYKKGIAVTQSKDFVYCATESGIFRLEKYNYEITPMSKISGLSDVGVNSLRYNFYNNTLLIAYNNANIDLIVGNVIYNIPAIKHKLITAKKNINNIYFRDQIAYLACGFGIVVLDMDKKEISDTYYIGTNSGYINVRDITSDDAYLYAATDSGIFRASLSSPNLADYNSWQKFTSLSKGIYNTIAYFNGKILANRAESLMSGIWGKDTVFMYDGNVWQKPTAIDTPFFLHSPVKKFEVGNNKLMIAATEGTDVFDTAFKQLGRINSYNNYNVSAFQAIAEGEKAIWIADNNVGLVKSFDIWNNDIFHPNGPNTSKVYDMKFSGEDLWVAPGDRSEIWSGTFNLAEAYSFSKENWTSVTSSNQGGNYIIPALDPVRDIVSVSIDPADKNHVYLGSTGKGLIELNNFSLTNIWDQSNSSLQSISGVPNYTWVTVYGQTFDKDGNLWMTNCNATNPLSVRKKSDNSWQSFNFSSLNIGNQLTVGQIIVNQYNQKWIQVPRGGGILVFNENATWGTNDDQMKFLTSGAGKGNLPSNEVECFAEDKEGQIWVGTDKGIAVFYCPDQVFSSSGCEAQQIFIEQDGHTQILLETEIVTAIAVDGANRKWIGTQNSGVYLMSADGTHQIQHFTVDNSPLLSNEIRTIAINPKTGEVYFGTVDGIISYRNDANEGLTDFTDVYVFPNPVQPGYEGPIAITGLIENAIVKITDISGALVYQTKALGGQAIWYGKNFKGEKAHSGVYMAFCANEDGSKTYVAKILLVN